MAEKITTNAGVIDMSNPVFDPAQIQMFMGKHGHGKLMGLEYVTHGDDWVDLALPYNKDLIGDTKTGVIASGTIITLMDNATSLAIWVKLKQFRAQATMDLRVDYLRPATPGKTVIGHGECYHIARKIAFVRGIAHDGDPDDPIAHVTGTFMKTNPIF